MKEEEFLIKWARDFFKHKDLIRKDIIEMIQENNRLIIKFKTKTQITIPFNKLEDFFKEYYDKEEWISIITFNTKDNFDYLIHNWKRFIEYTKLTIYFINPESKTDKKWHLAPKTHSIIADPDSLKQGLESLFSTVDAISSNEIKRIIN
jgi:hypothetical protein